MAALSFGGAAAAAAAEELEIDLLLEARHRRLRFGVLAIGQALAVTDACATSYTALLPHHGWHKRIG